MKYRPAPGIIRSMYAQNVMELIGVIVLMRIILIPFVVADGQLSYVIVQ